jgi:hypothetical protein
VFAVFRERQKATISTLEAEVSQKLAELQVLEQENDMLKLRSAVLEAVTSGREYHVSNRSCILHAAGKRHAMLVQQGPGERSALQHLNY